MPILFIFSPGHILGVWSLVNPDTSRWSRRENQVAVMTASPVQKGASPLKKVGDLKVKVVFGKGAKVPRDLFYEAFLSLTKRYFFLSFLPIFNFSPFSPNIPPEKEKGRKILQKTRPFGKQSMSCFKLYPFLTQLPFLSLSALVTYLCKQAHTPTCTHNSCSPPLSNNHTHKVLGLSFLSSKYGSCTINYNSHCIHL